MMIMRNLKEALVAMGYRKVERNKPLWMKPVGFSTIAIKVENNIVTMKLLCTYDETEVWSGYNFGIENDTDIVKKLKNGECQLMKDFCPVSGSMDSKFDFLTRLDQANLISGCI